MSMKTKIKNIIRLLKAKEMVPIYQPIDGQHLLDGKTALLTGGSGGIGFAIAKAFLQQDCEVIIAGTSEEKLSKCCEKLSGGGKAHYLVIDVTDVRSMPEKVCLAASKSSAGKIDILVNSAGLVAHSDFYHMTEEEYDSIMDVNTKGTYFMSQAVGKFMIEKKIKGHILNVTSSSALRPAWTPYQMSKWAVRGLTLGLADALLPYGIVVNAIAPGPVATPMLGKQEGDSIYNETSPSSRYAMPEEIAQLAVFMVSDMGNLIVGDTFYMTGGSGTITLHY
jgi:NAD(P)-dependent dehydrogenase (short-subunit alcohol dehydrogenase family)